MAVKEEFLGLETVMRNLNREIVQINGRCEAGLVSAALMIRIESQKLTPVVTGNLKNSAYVVSSKGVAWPGSPKQDAALHAAKVTKSRAECAASKSPMAMVGYTAAYAPYVHENPRAGKTGGFSPSGREYKPEEGSTRIVWSEVGQWKFLETALMKNVRRILAIIAAKAKI